MAVIMREQERSAIDVDTPDTYSRQQDDIRPDRSLNADRIAAEAYALFEERGREHGRDLDDWLEAERRLAGC